MGEGRLEVCIGRTWGTVCNEGWSNVEASVACRELGYSPTGTTHADTCSLSDVCMGD